MRLFVELCFKKVGRPITWKGKNLNEKGINNKTKELLIRVDKKYFRPNEVNSLKGRPYKIKNTLNFNVDSNIDNLIKDMIQYEFT